MTDPIDELTVRTCTDDDLPELVALISRAFLNDPREELLEALPKVFEPDRRHVAVDGDRLVGSAGVLTRDMTVPGGPMPTAHVTAVAVATTHRRRGLLRRIMNEQLHAIRERGTEPIAALWASEGGIYGRYGYGVASWNVEYEIPVLETEVPGTTPPGRLRHEQPAEISKTLADIHDRARHERPGVSARPGRWWEMRTLDPESRRRGMSAERAVVYEDEDGAHGYALLRTKLQWNMNSPGGEALVTEMLATNTEAYAALWRYLLSIDLVRTVRCPFGAVDEPLRHMATNVHALTAPMGPGLWVRVVDVPAALARRRYAAPIDVVLEITDAMFPDNAGRWHLRGDADSATCEATTAEPDLSLDVRGLGAAYLGGTSLQSLAAAGLVTEHRPGRLAAATTAFGWRRAPWSHEAF
ncbi:GNAT family N-acetyltransferase [Actinobacteria bacterium YIM 96077]|uniref:GNAT family N-acetyltransferase n=1 Tax=Phytoactinopolyspora halophila TaxID=1981511 RepID=A0A329QE43_9ACTN|nr:GNAT family N-acetyltransferase [Phytoactinopolyspora halophila]AYY14020.1 GNAT family N-acetyltransferase [Actinobacteria bacterium YIM 96077]RAW10271.1 GNAT family N-acetyltransferase [Phytoactinopolyspora halophila]